MNLETKTAVVKGLLVFLLTFCGLSIAGFVTWLVIAVVGWLFNVALPAINNAIVALPGPWQVLAWCAVAATGVTGFYVLGEMLKILGVALKNKEGRQ